MLIFHFKAYIGQYRWLGTTAVHIKTVSSFSFVGAAESGHKMTQLFKSLFFLRTNPFNSTLEEPSRVYSVSTC